ncbi:MAG: zinc ribbon domain-containing protein [Candidatus Desulfofervidus sp.]|nr:zinc ribbon domain-containing protein [Candidatus Desulfofervidus sp.]
MPIYEYICQDCGNQFECLVRKGEEIVCPNCQGKHLKRLVSACGFSFGKGSTKSNTSTKSTSSCTSCSAFS